MTGEEAREENERNKQAISDRSLVCVACNISHRKETFDSKILWKTCNDYDDWYCFSYVAAIFF